MAASAGAAPARPIAARPGAIAGSGQYAASPWEQRRWERARDHDHQRERDVALRGGDHGEGGYGQQPSDPREQQHGRRRGERERGAGKWRGRERVGGEPVREAGGGRGRERALGPG